MAPKKKSIGLVPIAAAQDATDVRRVKDPAAVAARRKATLDAANDTLSSNSALQQYLDRGIDSVRSHGGDALDAGQFFLSERPEQDLRMLNIKQKALDDSAAARRTLQQILGGQK